MSARSFVERSIRSEPRWREHRISSGTARSQSVVGEQNSCNGLETSSKERKTSSRLASRTSWVPIPLRRIPLLLHTLAFALLIAVLECLNVISSRDTGLLPPQIKVHYLWTYAPTVVITLVTVSWSQVEFRAKQMAPWAAMTRRPAAPAQSVLLDYLSPWSPLVLIAALQASQYTVSLAITGTLMLRLSIILSTSLLNLQYPMMTEAVTVTMLDSFGGTPAMNVSVASALHLNDYAISPMVFNISYRDGTTSRYAFQSFVADSQEQDQNATFMAEVNLAAPDLDCETARWTYQNSSHPYNNPAKSWHSELSFISSTCQVRDYRCRVSEQYSDSIDYSSPGIDEDSNIGWDSHEIMKPVQCTSATPQTPDRRLLIAFGYVAAYAANGQVPIDPNLGGPVTAGPPSSVQQELLHLTNLTALLCTPTLSFYTAFIRTLQGSNSTTGEIELVNMTQVDSAALTNVTAWDLAQEVASHVDSVFSSQDSDGTMFTLLNRSSPTDDSSLFMGPAYLQEASRKTYRALAAQWVKETLLLPANVAATGTRQRTQSRLYVEPLTLRLMEGIFGALAIGSLTCCFLGDRYRVPRDITSITGLAIVLARSQTFMRMLSGFGAASNDLIARWIRGYDFETAVIEDEDEKSFVIKTDVDDRWLEDLREPDAAIADISWWSPVSATTWFRIILVVAPLLLVLALELLLHYSAEHNGLGDTPVRGYLYYTWLFLPALIMVGLSSLYSMHDFAVRTIQPFFNLTAGGRAANRTITTTNREGFALFRACTSIYRREWGSLSTAVATLLAPLLTIAVSGLLLATHVPATKSVLMGTRSTFNTNISYNFLSFHDQSLLASYMVLYRNSSWPTGTFENLVLPDLHVYNNTTYNTSSRDEAGATALSVALPSLRVRPNCTVAPAGAYLLSNPTASEGSGSTSVRMATSSFQQCSRNETETKSYYTIHGVTRDGYFGAEPQFVDSDSNDCSDSDSTPSATPFVLGRTENGTIEGFSVVLCKPYVEAISINASLDGSTLALISGDSPTPDEQTTTLFSDDSTLFTIPSSDLPSPNDVSALTDTGPLSGFFEALVHSKYGIPIENLYGPSNSDTLVAAIERQWGIMLAQRLNMFGRNTSTPAYPVSAYPNPANLLNATHIDASGLRVVQSATATRILDGLLGALSLLAIITWLTLDTRKILPKNPLSIAAIASLLADSSLLSEDVIPKGSEWCSDKELAERGVLAGHCYSLGWWRDDEENKRARFGIDIGKAERAA